MADIFTKKKRSEVMTRVRSRGNEATELALARWFRREGITGWRRNQRVFGKPDFVFWKERVAVFVDGCFWHGCPRHGTMPKQNGSFWRAKLARNKARDRLVARTLRSDGWKVVRIWEHELRRDGETRLSKKWGNIQHPTSNIQRPGKTRRGGSPRNTRNTRKKRLKGGLFYRKERKERREHRAKGQG